jgi:predicted nucleic acid-binding Zn ribbon protein
MPIAIAHQAKIRAAHAAADPRPALTSLAGCTVEPITVGQAREIIVKYEWLGTMNRWRLATYGLWSPARKLLGAVSFGRVGSPEAHNICGPEFRRKTIALERGACVHFAPKNAASFLIRRACKQAHVAHGWSVFFAYGDPEAGEIGTIYQALGWRYLGRGLGRHHGYREEWQRPGETAWRSERILRHASLTKPAALALGWHHRRRAAKYVYIWFEDPAAALRCRYPALPYPKRPRLSRADARARARANRTCLVCAKPITAERGSRVTCSDACRVRLWRDRQRNGPRKRRRKVPDAVTVTARRKAA